MARQGIEQSLSHVGNCHDNAVMESFNGILKVEGLYNEAYLVQLACPVLLNKIKRLNDLSLFITIDVRVLCIEQPNADGI